MEKHWSENLLNKKSIIILLFLIFILLCLIVSVGLFTDRHIKLFGIEFNSEKKDTIIIYKTNDKHQGTYREEDFPDSNKRELNEVDSNKNYKKNENTKVNSSIKSENNKYNIKEVNATNLQIGDNNIQNIGIQPRKITEDFLKDFFKVFPDKTIYFGFVGSNSSIEIINTKKQIIEILEQKGYNNIEKTQGIRIMVNPDLPNEICIMRNELGGVSFYIP